MKVISTAARWSLSKAGKGGHNSTWKAQGAWSSCQVAVPAHTLPALPVANHDDQVCIPADWQGHKHSKCARTAH